MLYAGSDDGVYRVESLGGADHSGTQVLESDRAYRVRSLDRLPGLFAATASALFHSPAGERWTDLGVPTEHEINAVGVTADGERLVVGTYPAHLYALDDAPARLADGGGAPAAADWHELTGFLDLPAREDWGLPRHDFQAHVRSIESHPGAPDRLAVGVEVGGVHVSEDRGETWTERREGTHDDVHELHVAGPERFVAATGFGCFYSEDAGRSWTELSADVEQQYYRAATVYEGDVYAGGANGPSPTWPEDEDPGLYVGRGGGPFEAIASPVPDEVVIGWTEAAGTLVAVTYAGTLLRLRADGFEVVGSVPTPGDVRGRYLPLAWLSE